MSNTEALKGTTKKKGLKRIRRKFNDEHARLLKKLKLGNGGHSTTFNLNAPIGVNNKVVCVMEAIQVITGTKGTADRLDANPICVSPAITDFMISINDSRKNDRQRAMLKDAIPDIMGTCPISVNAKGYEVRAPMTDAYQKLEKRRLARIEKRAKDQGFWHKDSYHANGGFPSFDKFPTKKAIELARELAKMK